MKTAETNDLADLQQRIAMARKKSSWAAIAIFSTIIFVFGSSIINLASNIYFSYSNDIPFQNVDITKQQNKMWIKNLDCDLPDANWVRTAAGDLIAVRVCQSGDILIDVRRRDGREVARFVAADTFTPWPTRSK